jgi:hypothetical protein
MLDRFVIFFENSLVLVLHSFILLNKSIIHHHKYQLLLGDYCNLLLSLLLHNNISSYKGDFTFRFIIPLPKSEG